MSEKKWSEETCREEAKKYNTISDFNKGCASAYNVARKNGWITSYDWFEHRVKPKGYWNEETCHTEAMKYKTRKKFYEGNGSAYDAARKNGWLKNYDWFQRPDPINKKWNEITCLEAALKYTSRSEFKEYCASAYAVALRNGWLKDYYWQQNKSLFTEKGRWYNAYIYEWKDLQSVYVGITIDVQRRDIEHRKKRSSVFKFAYENKVDIPQIEVVEEKLLPHEAPNREAYYIDYYKKLGYTVINIAKAGSVGAFGAGKWNKTSCRKEAMKYKSRKAFSKGCVGAYGVALKNGWLDDYGWMARPEPTRKWTTETCREEAKKYKTKSEFYKKSSGAYDVARKNGWLTTYDWLEIKWEKKWNEETCRKEAQKYKSTSEFKKQSGGAYNQARKNGWIKDYVWLEQKRKDNEYWDYNTCKEEARKYILLSHFQKRSSSAYQVAKKNNWIADYDWFEQERKPIGYWNMDTCREEAKKYTSRLRFAQGNASAYHKALTNGWLDNYDWLVTPKQISKWNEKTCREEALKYRTKSQFKKGSSRAYNVARENGWIDDYVWLERRKDYSFSKE